MHQTYKANTKKYFDTKSDQHIDLFQIRSTPLGPGLPCPATLLFNNPIRGIMPTINILLISVNNSHEHYNALVKRQTQKRNHDTSRNYALIPIGFTLAVQKNVGLWTHCTIVGKGDHNHNDISCTICIMKTEWLITRKNEDVKPTQITAAQYLQDHLDKNSDRPLEDILKQIEKQTPMNHTYTQTF